MHGAVAEPVPAIHVFDFVELSRRGQRRWARASRGCEEAEVAGARIERDNRAIAAMPIMHF
jgi:hypothetical protein